MKAIRISSEAHKALARYRWPGNIRELKNILTFALYSMEEDAKVIEVRHLPSQLLEKESLAAKATQSSSRGKKTSREEMLEILENCQGNKSKAARALGISRTELYNRLKKLALDADSV
jgi:transcriptional regulator of acetoin/glycerol metabolism